MLEWAISSAALTALIIALRALLKGRVSLRLQYALWALVLVRLLVPVSFGATGLSIGNLTRKAAQTQAAQAVSRLTRSELPRMTYSAAYSEVAEEYAARGIDIAQMPEEDREALDGEIASYMGGTWTVRDAVRAVWIGGITAVAAVLLAANLRFAVKLRRSRSRLDGAPCPLPVYVSPDVETPCLFGPFRPAVYLPPEAAADGTVLRHTVEHELTHFRHGDHIWSLLRGACLALHWYDPLVWWAAVLSRSDAEFACDEATVARIGEEERAAYGRTLIEMTCRRRPALLLTATTMTGGKNGIKERIILLAKRPKTALCTLLAVLLIAAVAVGCTFTGAKDQDEQPLTIQMQAEGKIPAAVTDYAVAYTQERLDTYTDELGYEITQAKIVGLTQVNTGTAGLDSGVDLYRLEYRFLAADPGAAALTDGVQMEEDYITEWGSAGQPYLLLCWEDSGEETVWERICATDTDTIERVYGTPEMLERYSSAYTAAAMELYREHRRGGKSSPVDAVDDLFVSGSAELTLYRAGEGAWNTYTAGEWYAGRFEVLLDCYDWTQLTMPPTQPGDFWLTAVSPDGARSMTFWEDGGAGTVQYSDGDAVTFWSAAPVEDYALPIAEAIRREYDNLDVDFARISFPLDGDARAAADYFVHSAYGAHMASLAPGSMYGMSELEVTAWEVREVSEAGDAAVGWFECAFVPWDFESPGIWAGNTGEGTGEYEGKLTFYREFVLQRQEDGLWHCVGLGTGGYTLPE